MAKLIPLFLICFLTVGVFAGASDKITKINLNVYPAESVIRVNETAVLHAEFFGTRKKGFFERIFGGSKTEITKLQSNQWKIEIVGKDDGSLSKPFLYKSAEEASKGGLEGLLMRGLGIVSSKDAVLYTAPAKPGKYTVRLTEGALISDSVITVVAGAEKIRTEIIFGHRKPDAYFSIIERYAPFIAQETWFNPKADYIVSFDYDGNWAGDDNWENLKDGSSHAYVYYAVMETGTHWFLQYNFYHPRDYSDICVAGTCHENDYEGIIITVRKDGSEFGTPELIETIAHNNIYSFSNDTRIKKKIHDIDGEIRFYEETHPIVFIEAGGHGVFGSEYKTSLFDAEKMEFKQNTGITYLYKRGGAQSPLSGNDADIGYGLIPIEGTLWERGSGATDDPNETFEDFFVYDPANGRPQTSKKYIARSFKGRTASDNKARPFWGWYDRKTKQQRVLNTGQWALDPAHAVSVCYEWPVELPVETSYVFNPYLNSVAN